MIDSAGIHRMQETGLAAETYKTNPAFSKTRLSVSVDDEDHVGHTKC